VQILRALSASAASCVVAMAVVACGGSDDSSPPTPTITGDVTIKTLSNRPDMISDGDAYVEVVLPSGATFADLTVDVDRTDVTSSFAARADGRVLGVVSGLKNGTSTLTATLKSINKGAKLAITNTDRGGPIFSGPQIQPWICATKAGSLATVVVPGTGLSATVTTRTSGLSADPDAKCTAPATFTYYYEPVAKVGTGCTLGITGANPCFVAYDPAARPADRARVLRAARGEVHRGRAVQVVRDRRRLPQQRRAAGTRSVPVPTGRTAALAGTLRTGHLTTRSPS